MDREKKLALPAVGACSLLVIFTVLCLTVLALLSIASVQADERLSATVEEGVQAYYRADADAERILARLRSGELPEDVCREGAVYSYSCAISEDRCLAVQVAVEGETYEILRWQAISTTQWQVSEDLPVWDGDGRSEK